jgi:hypothetical protein
MSIKIADDSGLTVQTDPVIQLDNGICIWLGEKGEQVQIDPAAWAFISAAINHLRNIKVKNT